MRSLFFSVLVFFGISSFAGEPVKIKFGIVPQQNPTKLIQNWSPLMQRLSKDCACSVEFASAADPSTFAENLKTGMYEMAYMNPMHFVEVAIPAGYSALTRENGRKLKGILVVRKDSKIKEPAELTNQKVAFPDPTSFAASTLIQNIFDQKKIKIEPVYVKSHESVYKNVIAGLMPAGGGVNRTFEALSDADRDQLRILSVSQEVTPHPITIHKRVDAKIKAAILKSLISLNDSEDGKKLLADLDLKPLVAAKNADWDDVMKMLKANQEK